MKTWERGRGKKRAPPHGPPPPYLPLELDRASPAFLLPPLPGVEIEQPIAQKCLLEAPAAPLPRRWAAGTARGALGLGSGRPGVVGKIVGGGNRTLAERCAPMRECGGRWWTGGAGLQRVEAGRSEEDQP